MRRVTGWLLVACGVGLAAYDLYVAANRERGDTISEVTLDSSRKAPVLAFAAGFVAGHLFWPQRGGEA